MGLLDGILGQVSESATVENLAAKVGLSPEQVTQAIGALGQAHTQDGDTVETAAASTGLPTDALSAIVSHIGGEGSLGHFATLLQGDGEGGEGGGLLGGLSKLF